MAQESATHTAGAVKRGRPPLAPSVSQLPACTVPTPVHDAVIRESIRRDVSVARVVRDALISHLKNTGRF
jgi:hypothetical protein